MRPIAAPACLLFALLTGAASSAPQDEPAMTAGDLQQLCLGTDHVSVNACRIYILGVTQGIEVGLGIADGKIGGGRPCVPADTSAEALQSTIKKKLDADLAATPADRERDAARFIATVLLRAFPCSAAHH